MNQINKIRVLAEKTDVGLFISGSAASKNLLFTGDELDVLPKREKQIFSVYDDHEQKESRHIEEGTGVPMADFLGQAGVEDADEVKLRSVDGFESVVSELHARRYYFPGLTEGDESGREVREPLVSFYKNGKKAKFYPHPTIMFGQQGLEDKNKDFFAKGARYLQAGNRDRAFWAKGDRLACSRYFGVDQVFALNEDGEDAVPLLELTAAGSVRGYGTVQQGSISRQPVPASAGSGCGGGTAPGGAGITSPCHTVGAGHGDGTAPYTAASVPESAYVVPGIR
ncbi:MAG: hypothetical protein LIO75_05820, partial [Lachnospiraceae bacterium]|nr:hypothetical protein [Lachnospiraceae bacterium]